MVNINEKIALISEKLTALKAADTSLSIFGAETHKYQLNEKLTNDAISAFENKYAISLPAEYRAFLLTIGNGGAGPYYGLQTLNDSLYSSLDYKDPTDLVDPSTPFPFNEAWNMRFTGDSNDEEAYHAFETEYFSNKWETGLLKICNFGCGISLNLVVNGAEKGNIWVDDRGNDAGCYPDPYFGQSTRTSFLDWYLLWLNASLAELKTI